MTSVPIFLHATLRNATISKKESVGYMENSQEAARRCWDGLEDRHEAMTAEERERWYETGEGQTYVSLLQDSWREEWDELSQAAYERACSA